VTTILTRYDAGYDDGYHGRSTQWLDTDYLAGFQDGSYDQRQKRNLYTTSPTQKEKK
jgi:hypothetical protein